MQAELIALRRRVVQLEAAVIVLVVTAVVIASGAGSGTTVAAQGGGPSKVVAPFQVVDGKGRQLFSVQANEDGGGVMYVFDAGGDVDAAVGSGKGVAAFRAISKGNARLSMGVSQKGDGLIRLAGPASRYIQLESEGVFVANDAGQTVVRLGIDGSGHGHVNVLNRAGQEMASLAADPSGGGGRVSVSTQSAIVGLMGTLVNGKGEVCVNGAPGKQVCMTGLALKTFTPF